MAKKTISMPKGKKIETFEIGKMNEVIKVTYSKTEPGMPSAVFDKLLKKFFYS